MPPDHQNVLRYSDSLFNTEPLHQCKQKVQGLVANYFPKDVKQIIASAYGYNAKNDLLYRVLFLRIRGFLST